jgi:FtsZ-binding cell division protein ZapB
MLILDDLFKGFIGLARKIQEMAMEELQDTPEKLQRELLDGQMMLEAGQITEEEYQKREQNILQRLNALMGK